MIKPTGTSRPHISFTELREGLRRWYKVWQGAPIAFLTILILLWLITVGNNEEILLVSLFRQRWSWRRRGDINHLVFLSSGQQRRRRRGSTHLPLQHFSPYRHIEGRWFNTFASLSHVGISPFRRGRFNTSPSRVFRRWFNTFASLSHVGISPFRRGRFNTSPSCVFRYIAVSKGGGSKPTPSTCSLFDAPRFNIII